MGVYVALLVLLALIATAHAACTPTDIDANFTVCKTLFSNLIGFP
jgi:hypothetical protein